MGDKPYSSSDLSAKMSSTEPEPYRITFLKGLMGAFDDSGQLAEYYIKSKAFCPTDVIYECTRGCKRGSKTVCCKKYVDEGGDDPRPWKYYVKSGAKRRD